MRADRTWRWFLTITAIEQWMIATGRGGDMEEDNPEFVAARDELGELSITAKLAESATDREHPGSLIYRGKVTVRGKRVRVECYVRAHPHDKDKTLPQLVRVRRK